MFKVMDMGGQKSKLGDNKAGQMPSQNQMIDETQHIRELMLNFKYNADLKTQLAKDLKALNLKAWFCRSGNEVPHLKIKN